VQDAGHATVTNTGALSGANISLTARAAEGLATGVVNVSGTIVAHGVHNQGGTVVLDAGNGGNVDVSRAVLNASGPSGGGDIRIGGWNQNSVVVGKSSTLIASAGETGNGGNISVIASATDFEGRAIVQGGRSSGNGGAIETSGHVLSIDNAGVDASAPHGTSGNWSLDPENVTISAAGNSNGAISGGVFTPSGDNSVLKVKTLENALKKANITVTTGTVGTQAGDITVVAPLTWSAHTLTLDAYHSVVFDAQVTATGTAGLAIKTDDGGSGGSYYLDSGNITFASTSEKLSINGNAYTLVDTITTYLGDTTPSLASEIAANPSGYYALAVNDDESADGQYSASPIPTTFTGVFEGLGNVISNLNIRDDAAAANVGLFADVGTGGIVRDVELQNETVQGHGAGDNIGGIAGSNTGSVENASVAVLDGEFGDIEGGRSANLGGLVGSNAGSILSSFVTEDVSAAKGGNVGGLVGSNGGTVTNSYADGDVSAGAAANVGGLAGYSNGQIGSSNASGNAVGGDSSYVGGLVGYAGSGGEISGADATGNVLGGVNAYLGGLAAYNNSSISSSEAGGNVITTGAIDVGGLVGLNGSKGIIISSDASGAIRALASSDLQTENAGGLVGMNNGSIEFASASGAVSPSSSPGESATPPSVGGLVGWNTGAISNSSAHGSVSNEQLGPSYAGGLVGYSSASIYSSYAYGSVDGYDYVGGLAGYSSGLISASTASGAVGQISGGGTFSGGLVGYNDYVIRNSSATGNVMGSDAGGLAGYNDSQIVDSSASGTVYGSLAGGLVGENYIGGTIARSFASGSVTAQDDGGGLVGLNESVVRGSYSTASVGGYNEDSSALQSLGGLVGENDFLVKNSYANGAVTCGRGTVTCGGFVGNNVGETVNSNAEEIIEISNNDLGYGEVTAGGFAGSNEGSIVDSYDKNKGLAGSDYIDLVDSSAFETTIGGFVGANGVTGSIENSYATAGPIAIRCGCLAGYSFQIGGYVGDNSGAIQSSWTKVAITSSSASSPFTLSNVEVGGFAGTNETGGTIATSFANGGVLVGSLGEEGGFVGRNDGSISTSFATGAVNGGLSLGGFVGNNNSGSIQTSYSTGTVGPGTLGYGSDEPFLGGFAGVNSGTISQTYAADVVTTAAPGDMPAGGFVGQDNSSGGISFSYWDTDVSSIANLTKGAGNIANDIGISGLSTAVFQSGLPSGFASSIWGENSTINNGLPYLLDSP